MLGAYNVNGASCELLIDQEALVWWPRAATANSNTTSPTTATSVRPNNLSSPLRHLRSLSRGGSSNTGSSGDFDDAEELQRRRRRIDFGQIIGVTKVYIKRRGRSKKRPSDRNQATISDEIGITATTTTRTSTPIKQRDDSEIREQAKQADSLRQLTKLKIYYAKKNEKRSTGRLLKLKKVTLGLLQSNNRDHDNSIDQNDSVHQTSPPTSSTTTTTTSTSDSSSLASQVWSWPRDLRPDSSALNDLYELIEQHLELKRRQRPRRLLVFVNPIGGKGKALQLYKSKVRKLLDLAQVECQLVVTKYANHARNTIEDPMFNLEYFDGIICIGGDGMFAELMNGLLFRFNRDKLLSNELNLMNRRLSARLSMANDEASKVMSETETSTTQQELQQQQQQQTDQKQETAESETLVRRQQLASQLEQMRSSLGGIGEQFQSPNIPIGVIGAGSTDANLFGFIGTNDTVSATLNIILGNQIQIDVCSIHSIQEDRLLRFVSTFVAYGYFGDVIRESEKLRWLGPSRYDVTALNSLIKYRCYDGLVRIVRSTRDGTPLDLNRCHLNCSLCKQTGNQVNMSNNNNLYGSNNNNHLSSSTFNDCDKTDLAAGDATEKQTLADGGLTQGGAENDEFEIIEEEGSFVGVNAAVTACRCPQTRKGFSPGNHLANGCADLILVRPCSRMQYINYLIRTGYTSKSAFDLRYVDAYRCRQFEFLVKQQQQQQQQPQLQQPQQQQSSDRRMGNSATDDSATSDYQSKGSTKLSTNDTSIASSRQSSNANSLDSKHFADHHMTADLPSPMQQPDTKEQTFGQVESPSGHDPDCDELGSSSWNADGEILREQSIRVKVNNKLLRVFGTGEPQPRSRCQRKQ